MSSSDSDSEEGFPEIVLKGDRQNEVCMKPEAEGSQLEESNSENNSGMDAAVEKANPSIEEAWQRRLVKTALQQEEKKVRLPVKNADGTVVRNDAFDDEGSMTVKTPNKSRNLGPLLHANAEEKLDSLQSTTGQFLTKYEEEEAALAKLPRLARLEGYKIKMATLAEAIIEDPRGSLKHTKDEISRFDQMHQLCTNKDPAIRRLATISTYAIFKDILPPYRIRVATDSEMSAQMKKETRALREFEKLLLSVYQRYLKALDAAASGKSRGELQSSSFVEIESMNKRCKRLALAAVSCMGMLVEARPKFNYRSNIVSSLVMRLNDKWEDMRRTSRTHIEEVIRNDKNGELSLEIVRAISSLVKTKKYNVSTDAIDCLLHVPLTVDLKSRKVQKDLAARTKKKRKLNEVDRGLIDGSAIIDSKAMNKNQAAILKDLFNMYFRILKRTSPSSPLVGAALHGVAKYSHLINIDLVGDLVDVLGNMTKSDGMDLSSGLQCILAALRTLSGPGLELQMDDSHFLAYLFKLIPRLANQENDQHVGLAMMCLQIAFVKRREHSMERVSAFVKRLFLLAVDLTNVEHVLASMSFARSLLNRYPSATQLLDCEEERKACPGYRMDVDDPEHCNSFGSTLWEINFLAKHFHPAVRKMAADTLKLVPPLPNQLPRLLLIDFDTSNCAFNPPVPLPEILPKNTREKGE